MSSPFGDTSEFQEEEVHETSYEDHDKPKAKPEVSAPTSSFPQPSAPPAPVPAAIPSSSSSLSASSDPFSSSLEDPFATPITSSSTPSSSSSSSSSSVLSLYASAAGVAIPPPTKSTFGHVEPPALAIRNGAPSLSSTSSPAISSSLPRIGSSPPTFDNSRSSLDSLWTAQADTSSFTHAAYSSDKFFGKYEVKVSDPEKKGDGLNSHISYKVTSSLELQPGNMTNNTVSRRYSDFLWLHENLFLTNQYAGFLIPPIPDKAVIGRFGEDFVEERRRNLELFLKRALAHPVVSREKNRTQSNKYSQQEYQNAKNHKKKPGILSSIINAPAGPAGTGGGNAVVNFFKARADDIQSAFVSSKPHDKSPDDAACEKADLYAASLENELLNINDHLEMLMKREKNVARTWIELGMSSGVLTQCEGAMNEKTMVSVFTILGGMSDSCAVMLARKVELEKQGLRDTVKDHVRLAGAVQQTMRVRQTVAENYYQSLQQLEKLQAKQNPKDPTAHAALTAEQKTVVQQRQQELFDVTARARVEFARFQKEKTRAIKEAVKHFVRLQIEYAQQAATAWDSILPDLESLP